MLEAGIKKHNEVAGQSVAGMLQPEINLDMILKIHPKADAHIAFTRKINREIFDKKGRKKNFETLFSIEVGKLKSMFPQMRLYLYSDSYFSVNGFYRAAPY